MLRNAPQTGTGDLLISVQAIEPIRVPIPDDDSWFVTQLHALRNNDPDAEKAVLSAISDLYGLTTEEVKFIESQCIQ
jgi:hypothetical protein